jgi:predicted aspartyl protease
MQLELRDGLPFVNMNIAYQDKRMDIAAILVDTGSATSILSADQVAAIGIKPSPEYPLYIIRGVGGSEAVFGKRVDYLEVGGRRVDDFEIEVGRMDFGFEMNGILGMNFLIATGATIDLNTLEINFP